MIYSRLPWALVVPASLFGACQSAPMTAVQRQLLAQDVRDAILAAKPWIGTGVEPYLAAAEPLLLAFVAGDPIEPAAWLAIAQAEPMLRQALLDSGRSAEETDSMLALMRIALRRIESALAAPPP